MQFMTHIYNAEDFSKKLDKSHTRLNVTKDYKFLCVLYIHCRLFLYNLYSYALVI